MNIQSNIYNFMDYREFLKDRYRQLKEADPIFSFRHFSKEAGFGSPNYLKLVMDGKRNLSQDAIAKFAKGLRLDNHESEYFRYMVEFNQCEHDHKKKVFEAKLTYLKELFKVKSLIPELYDYYHEWYHAAIREIVKKGAVANDPGVIATQLTPAITVDEAKASIELLKKLKFVVETSEGLSCTEDSAVDSTSAAAAQKIYFEQMAELATQSLYTQGPDTQDFESLTVTLPVDKVTELKKQIHELILSVAKTSGGAGEAVYQLNIQLFALTKPMGVTAKSTDIVA